VKFRGCTRNCKLLEFFLGRATVPYVNGKAKEDFAASQETCLAILEKRGFGNKGLAGDILLIAYSITFAIAFLYLPPKLFPAKSLIFYLR